MNGLHATLSDSKRGDASAVSHQTHIVGDKGDTRRRLHGAIREFVATERRLDHPLHGQQRTRRAGADADTAELVFKDVRVADGERVRTVKPEPFGDLPRRAAADHRVTCRREADGSFLVWFPWVLRESRA